MFNKVVSKKKNNNNKKNNVMCAKINQYNANFPRYWYQCIIKYPFSVADSREGPAPPFFRQNWGPKGRKKILETGLPLISGSEWPPSPPHSPSYLKVWICHCIFFLGIIISKGNAQAPKAHSKKLLPMRKRNIQLAIFTWCPISLILFSPDENTGVSIFIHCLLRNRHRKIHLH